MNIQLQKEKQVNRAVKANLEKSEEVVRSAWEKHTIELSDNMRAIGKPVGDRYLNYQFDPPKDVRRTNFLKQFKLYLGGSYLTRVLSGEIIFADIEYYRSLFLVKWNFVKASVVFFRVNALWADAQAAFFNRDKRKLEALLVAVQAEINRLRRALATDEDFTGGTDYKESDFRIRSVRFIARLKVFRLFRRR